METLLRNLIPVFIAFTFGTVSAIDCDKQCQITYSCCLLYDCCYPDIPDIPDIPSVDYPILSVGAIVGIVIGCLVLLGAIIFGIVCCCVIAVRRKGRVLKGRTLGQQFANPQMQYAYPPGGGNAPYPVQQQVPQQQAAAAMEMPQPQPYGISSAPPYPDQHLNNPVAEETAISNNATNQSYVQSYP